MRQSNINHYNRKESNAIFAVFAYYPIVVVKIKEQEELNIKFCIPKKDSFGEQRFKIHVKAWTESLNSILKYVKDKNQGWRFIRCNPEINDTSIKSATLCKDFLDFTDLLVLRRDIDM